MQNVYNIPLTVGVTPQGFVAKLKSQQIQVKGVVVDNANSTLQVWVYSGSSPSGTPFIVLPGWSRGFAIDGVDSCYILFVGAPSATGSVYIAVSSEPQSAFSTQVITSITGPVPVLQSGAWTVGATKSGTWNIDSIVNTVGVSGSVLNTKVNDYPNNSNPWATKLARTSFVTGQSLFSHSLTIGQIVYLSFVRINGFDDQAIGWNFSLGGVLTPVGLQASPAGLGDADDVYATPLQIAQAQSTGVGSVSLTSSDTLIGTVNIWLYVGGYYL